MSTYTHAIDYGGTANGTVWTSWNTTYSTSTTATTNNYVWTVWTATVTSSTISNGTGCYRAYEPTAEQRRLANEQQEKFRIEQEEQREKERQKEETARQLLREVLSEEQDQQLSKDGFFELVAVKSGNRYRIKKGRSMNVQLLDKEGVVKKTLCFHPTELVHDYDTMAAQKLMLEYDEEIVKKVANYRDWR